MRRMVSVCSWWTAEKDDHVRRGIAPVILKGKEGEKSMDLKRLNEDIEAVREMVNHYEVIAGGFDEDHQMQRTAWNKKSDLANRVFAYLLALKNINYTLEIIKEEMCGNYCMYPEIWDAEAEGCELAESKHCQNCPLNRL